MTDANTINEMFLAAADSVLLEQDRVDVSVTVNVKFGIVIINMKTRKNEHGYELKGLVSVSAVCEHEECTKKLIRDMIEVLDFTPSSFDSKPPTRS